MKAWCGRSKRCWERESKDKHCPILTTATSHRISEFLRAAQKPAEGPHITAMVSPPTSTRHAAESQMRGRMPNWPDHTCTIRTTQSALGCSVPDRAVPPRQQILLDNHLPLFLKLPPMSSRPKRPIQEFPNWGSGRPIVIGQGYVKKSRQHLE